MMVYQMAFIISYFVKPLKYIICMIASRLKFPPQRNLFLYTYTKKQSSNTLHNLKMIKPLVFEIDQAFWRAYYDEIVRVIQ